MFKLTQKYEVDRRILKREHIRYSPAETSLKNTASSQIYNSIHCEVSAVSLLNTYLDLYFEVIKKS